MMTAHVLIVDDDLVLLQALPEAMCLRMPDVTVSTSSSALAALSMIAENDYDAIITDIKMPGMDGLALLAKVRSLRPNTPTLLITGHGEHDLAVQALRGGAYDFIQKPIDRDYFVASLQRAIQTRQLRREIEAQQAALARHALELEAAVQERTRELLEANALKDELLQREQEARALAEAAVRVREQFLGIASHELKTPLTSIKAYTQMLARQLQQPDLDRDRLEGYAKRLHEQLGRLEILVGDLLDASRIQQGRLELQIEPVDLVALAEQVLDRFDGAPDWTPEHRLILEASEPVTGHWDTARLDQVLTNLVSNALKYSPEGGEVRLSIRQVDNHAVVAVSDQGLGIAADDQGRLFQPFMRGDAVRGSVSGSGLGLYISSQIVEHHEGTITFDSRPGAGTTFTVHLPLVSLLCEQTSNVNF